jgi:uncharacterized protein (DUF302 family)
MEDCAAKRLGGKTMLYQVESKKKVSDLARDLEAAVQRNKFGVMGVHDLKAKMKEKGVDFERECLIFEVCNPVQAKRVLEKNMEISTALPCRISVYSEGAGAKLATLRPLALIAMYKAEGLEQVAEEVEQTLIRIMEEAAR